MIAHWAPLYVQRLWGWMLGSGPSMTESVGAAATIAP